MTKATKKNRTTTHVRATPSLVAFVDKLVTLWDEVNNGAPEFMRLERQPRADQLEALLGLAHQQLLHLQRVGGGAGVRPLTRTGERGKTPPSRSKEARGNGPR